MSKTVITAEMVGDSNSPLIGMFMADGDDRPKVNVVYDSVEDAQIVKSLRLPTSLYNAAVAQNHAQGFSGVVRDALTAYLESEPDEQDVRHALAVIERAVLSNVKNAA